MTNFFYRLFLLAPIFCIVAPASAQPWMKETVQPNFHEMRKVADQRVDLIKNQKSKGFKVVKRWENYWEPRVNADGSFPPANFTQNSWNDYVQNAAPLAPAVAGSSWSSNGPNSSSGGYAGIGRINRITPHPSDASTVFACSAGGGLWKTTNGGSSWTPLTDQLASIGTSGLAINPNGSADTMYLATGDGDGFDTYSYGVLKSTDGGTSWSTTGLSFTPGRVIYMLVIHPSNPNILLAATSNGVYKTTDGGTTWTHPILSGYFYDIEFKPGDPSIIYAATDTGIYRSTDTGASWTKTFAISGAERIAIAVSAADPTFVGALIANYSDYGFLGFYASTDSGANFGVRTTTPNLLGWSTTGNDSGGQGWYDLCIAIAPNNANNIYIGGVNTWKSTDGGYNWSIMSNWYYTGTTNEMHADQHDLVFQSSTTMYAANDGGIYRSTNAGSTWSDISNSMVISQMYRGSASQTDAKVIAGLQDNGTKLRSTSGTWTDEIGGDGMECAIDPSNSNYMYGTLYYGDLRFSSNGGSSWSNITPSGSTGAWVSPFLIDPTTPSTIYIGHKSLYKSTNRGSAWTNISSTLTGNNNISQIAVAPSNSNIIFISWYQSGTYKYAKTTDGGGTWTTANLPSNSSITSIAIDPVDPNIVYCTFSNFTSGAKVYMSTNGGSTWSNFSGTLPNIPANKIICQTGSDGGVYLGMDVGIYYRDNTMSDWGLYNSGLPNVEIYDLEIRYSDNKLFAITYGRGLWVSPLYVASSSAPAITSFSPTSAGSGSSVTITGTNLTGATAVSFGGTAAASFTVNSATQITAVVAAGSSGSVSVTTPDGSTSKTGFTFLAAPAITSFTPTSAAQGASVVITGTNFTGATAISFGGTAAASFIVNSATQITAVVGVGSSGSVAVTTPGGSAASTGFTFVVPSPTISSFSPTSAKAAQTVTITGTNLSGATAVTFGGVAASSFTVNSATQITAVVGNGSTGSVAVTNPGGTGTLAGFTFLPAPTISSFTPTSGATGASITITGTNFSGATSVKFGGVVASSFIVNSATQITAVVGSGASGNVNIATPGGVVAKSGFTFLSAPTISSFTPTSGITGTTVTITGTNLSGATSVKFGGVAASSFIVNSATQITAVVGSGASGSVSVTTPGGTATLAGFTYSLPTPTITSFTPTSAKKAQTVTIIGTNFSDATAVTFGGVAATFTIVSATQISAVVGNGASGNVVVTTSAGTASKSGFTFIPAPTISSFTPTSGGTSTSVTITGTNLSGATAVKFGGVNATSFTVNSATQITAIVGSGASGNVNITTPGGTAAKAGFTFIPAPTISSFTPTSAATGATVTITGTNFTGATLVKFGGTNATSFIVNSATQITAVVGSGASGSISVTTPGGTGSKAGFTFIPAPTISSFTPTSAGTGATVTITGTNFTGTTSVKFGGTNATSFTVNSATQISAVVASGTSGSIAVTTPGGTTTMAGFTFSNPAPTIASFSPTSAKKGTNVVITGTNFSGATSVKFGGVNATSFTINSATQITAKVGNGASGNITVTTPSGTGSKAGFTFIPAPTISSFTPTSAGTGASVTITGTNLTGATLVKFGGVNASSFIVNSATQITAVVGSGASGSISITTPGGTTTKTGFLFVSSPIISSFTPTSAAPGTVITISGTNLTGTTAVKFGGVNAASFTVLSPTQITAVVASGSSGNVTVTTPGGTASFAGFSFSQPLPSISSFSPATAKNGQNVIITGSNFTGATAVKFGGVSAAAFTVNSDNQITAKVGTGASGTVTITNGFGTGTRSGFTFIPTPKITSFSPTSAAPGATVTITGTNLTGATVIKFGGVAAASFVVNSATQITAVVGNGASGNVAVTTPGGVAAKAGFTFIPGGLAPIPPSKEKPADELQPEKVAFSVYPNPVNDWLYIQAENAATPQDIAVFAATGQQVIKIRAIPAQGLDVSRLAPGIYVLVLNPQGERQVIRFAKE